ncbi:MAG: hypothetical protein LBC02_12140 [Planctomycetaceae bacterium]|jgi:hypothetical protein|nr:hypothetical protein [Planctomycetaceae bacterium]
MQLFSNLTVQTKLAHPHDLLTRYFLIDIELFTCLLERYGGTRVIRLIDLPVEVEYNFVPFLL